ncbi:MAG: zf-TFIIB domain-containing protein [Candidatus Thermoplasmatota archaeon]|nr:zf-TFIIB domain-containing protein [Candidatus Thermoplasmatota archaeon]
MTSKGNRERCPACGREITEYLGKGAIYNCPQCRRHFALKWSKSQRDFVFIDLADRGKEEPLNLPRGSVRSLITLIFCGTLWLMIFTGKPAPPFLLETILIVFGYYFALRSTHYFYHGSQTVVDKNTKEPLNMPKGSIRWVLVTGFAIALLYSLLRDGRLYGDYISFYYVLGGITIGYIFNKIANRFEFETPMWLRHLKAAAVLCIVVFISLSALFGFYDSLPFFFIGGSIAFAGFYFGSR